MSLKACFVLALSASLLSTLLTGCGGVNDALNSIGQKVYVDPPTPVLDVNQTQNLSTYLLEGGVPDDYTWTLREGSAGGALAVTIDAGTGLHSRATYTAPSTAGTYHVDVTTTVDGVTEKGTSTISVQ